MSLRLVACQEALHLTRQMLEAARQGLWDDLPALQAARATTLKALEYPAEAQAQAQVAAELPCLQQMLDAEPELQALVLARRSELSRLLSDRQTGRVMSRAYGRAPGAGGSL